MAHILSQASFYFRYSFSTLAFKLVFLPDASSAQMKVEYMNRNALYFTCAMIRT